MIVDEFHVIASRVLKGYRGADSVRILAIEPGERGPVVRWEGPLLARDRDRRPLPGGGTALGPVPGPVLLDVLARTLSLRWRSGAPRCPPDWDLNLARRYPKIFGGHGPETGPGWCWLWEGGAQAIVSAGVPRNFKTADMKEKFGGIRWYQYAEEDCEQVDDIVEAVEALSISVCEDCGRPGRLRRGSWIKTQCDIHGKGR